MSSTKTVYRWFWVWQFEEEEAWLNTMAQSGWALERVGYCKFVFTSCAPGEYIVRLEMHDHDESYLDFLRETGAEYIGRVIKFIYFRRKAAEGPFDLFSDIDSRIGHLNLIGRLLFILGMMNLIIGVINSFNPVGNFGWISLLVSTLLMYGLGRIHGKRDSLEKERLLRE